MTESSESKIVASFEKNSREEVRITVDDFHGRRIINLRVFFKGENGDWRPSKKGLAVSVDRYRDLAEAILQLGEELKKEGLL